MQIFDLLSPVFRRKKTALVLWILFGFGLWSLGYVIPTLQKSTVYFTVKTLPSEQFSLDPIESGSKVAEMIAGWVKDPGFRNEILETANIDIPDFRKKITARKQNRMNVFITLKFIDEEGLYADRIAAALISVLQRNLDELNTDNAFPAAITPPRVVHDLRLIPKSWILGGSIFGGLFLMLLMLYGYELAQKRISFLQTLYELFPESPILRVPEKLGRHDAKLLEQFILTFESPRLIGTFPVAGEYFSLAPLDAVNEEMDTPIFLVKLGTTPLHELENLLAIFGDEIGIIVFEK